MSIEKTVLECKECGCKDLRVYYTRHFKTYIRRVRICRYCGRRLATRESLEQDKNETDDRNPQH